MKRNFFNLLLSLSVLTLTMQTSFAQYSLDEIRIIDQSDTRLLGINDAGFVCGFFSTFSEKGFVITPSGKVIQFENPTGFTNTRVVAINNRDTPVVVIRAANSSGNNVTATVFKSYYTPQNDSFGPMIQITGIPVSNPNPTGINNSNQIIGYFASGSPLTSARFLWIYFDSLATMPGNFSTQYYATRYEIGNNAQPTYANSINENGIICGYYYDLASSSYGSFTFDMSTKLFNGLSNLNNRMLTGINDAGFVVGKFTLGLNSRSFMGNYTGNTLSSIPIPIFYSGSSIQSEFTGVNNNDDIIGNYQHPNTLEWVAFIYRKNTPEFRLPGFNFNLHTWKMKNMADSSNSPGNIKIWTKHFYEGFDYNSLDPYTNQAIPIIENLFGPYTGTFDTALTFSWKGFCQETDPLNFPELIATQSPKAGLYQLIFKKLYFDNYILSIKTKKVERAGLPNLYKTKFNGYCYGFTYTALQKLYDSATYKEWFGYTQNLNAALSDNHDMQAILSIERSQMKQLDKDVKVKYNPNNYDHISVPMGMFRLKNEFQKSMDKINPRGMGFTVLGATSPTTFTIQYLHAVMPYKIKTPKHLPFNYPNQQYDTLYVYDSNHPSDSNQFFGIKSDWEVNSINHDSIFNNSYSMTTNRKVSELNLNYPGVKDLPGIGGHKQISQLKPTGINDDSPYYTFGIVGSSKYSIKNSTGDSATLSGDLWKSDINNLLARIPDDGPIIPHGFLYDTSSTANLIISGYQENGYMDLINFNNTWSMSISRLVADSTETDYGQGRHKYWAYGTKDNITKNLTLQFVQGDLDGELGSRFILQNFSAKKNDSIITSSPQDYGYQVTRIGGDPLAYDLKSFIWENNSMKTVATPIQIDGNTTHVFDPYYNGPNGHQLVIYVDNGNNGNYNDTIFLVSTGLEELINVDYISIYPNPASDELKVQLKKNLNANFDLTLTDYLGRVILKQQLHSNNGIHTIPISSLGSGLYIIQITQDGKTVYRDKVVKK